MNTADRELLEAAAKAAGLTIVRSRLDDPSRRDMLLPAIEGRGVGWNPLTDDGDALRLVVAVKLAVNVWGPGVAVMHSSGHDVATINEPAGDDIAAATRRAIVRAAAAIGATL